MSTSKVLTIEKIEGKPGQVYYPLKIKTVPKPRPGPGEVLVRVHAAALNHRDHFIRQHLYPNIAFDAALLADGVGTVEEVGPPPSSDSAADASKSRPPQPPALGSRVLLTPSRGWARGLPHGPADPRRFSVVGGAALVPEAGTAQEWVVAGADEVEPCPPHLTAAQAAALPLVGLTAWRAVVTKLGPEIAGRPGSHVLVTGVGGGVALAAAQIAVALGLRVWVTSGSEAKLERAVREVGAEGGVSYRAERWERDLAAILPPERPWLDAVVDGAGGDVVSRSVRLLRPGGVISAYGMTSGPRMDWSMAAVLNNLELRGSTMGSRSEFADMVRFVAERRLVPIVSRTVRGLDNLPAIEGLFADMRDGKQFGKLVIEISDDDDESGGDATTTTTTGDAADSPSKL